MFTEADLRPISALQHLAFCERQCCLIHVEQVWAENRLTAEGRVMHEHVHEQEAESRGALYIVRGLKLRSLELGLSGVADVVEFHRVETGGVTLDKKRGKWQPFPVEYKRGKPKSDRSDEIQLCAQALCLEEMLGVRIHSGALYYGMQRRRTDVAFDEALRKTTAGMTVQLHKLLTFAKTPKAVYGKKCNNCSLVELCMPQAGRQNGLVAEYIESGISDEGLDDDVPVV